MASSKAFHRGFARNLMGDLRCCRMGKERLNQVDDANLRVKEFGCALSGARRFELRQL